MFLLFTGATVHLIFVVLPFYCLNLNVEALDSLKQALRNVLLTRVRFVCPHDRSELRSGHPKTFTWLPLSYFVPTTCEPLVTKLLFLLQ